MKKIRPAFLLALALMGSGLVHAQSLPNDAPRSAVVSSVVINEIMAFNTTTITDEMGEFEDWIELYNTSGNAVDLTGWYLTDNPLNLAKWDFPVGTSLASGTYLIIWADEDSLQGPMHANFKLSSTLGETVWLLDPTLATVDSVQFGPQAADVGYARVPNGTGPFMVQSPTFNANNSPTAVSKPLASESLIAFPNPANNVLYLRKLDMGREVVSVYNAVGMQVLTLELEGTMSIPTGDLANGIYIIRGESDVLKFVVAH